MVKAYASVPTTARNATLVWNSRRYSSLPLPTKRNSYVRPIARAATQAGGKSATTQVFTSEGNAEIAITPAISAASRSAQTTAKV
jgi:hypothetical protein